MTTHPWRTRGFRYRVSMLEATKVSCCGDLRWGKRDKGFSFHSRSRPFLLPWRPCRSSFLCFQVSLKGWFPILPLGLVLFGSLARALSTWVPTGLLDSPKCDPPDRHIIDETKIKRLSNFGISSWPHLVRGQPAFRSSIGMAASEIHSRPCWRARRRNRIGCERWAE